MGIEERQQLATEGIVVAAVDIVRGSMASSSAQETVDAFSSPSGQPPQAVSRPTALRAQIRVTTRAMWVDSGRLLEVLHKVWPSCLQIVLEFNLGTQCGVLERPLCAGPRAAENATSCYRTILLIQHRCMHSVLVDWTLLHSPCSSLQAVPVSKPTGNLVLRISGSRSAIISLSSGTAHAVMLTAQHCIPLLM